MKEQIEKYITRWKNRPYSWSQHSSFDWDKEQWFYHYVMGKKQTEPSDFQVQMDFGKEVDESIESGEKPMAIVPKQESMQLEIVVSIKGKKKSDDFMCIGKLDSGSVTEKAIEEYKTTNNPKKWNQKSVDNHKQLTMYVTLLYIGHGIKPETVKIRLHDIRVAEGSDFAWYVVDEPPHTYNTQRTLTDVLMFIAEMRKRRIEMEKYARNMFVEKNPV